MDSPLIGASFDLARESGYAIWYGEKPTEVGTITLPKDGVLGEQGSLFRRQLMRVLPPGLDWVAFEDARAVSKHHGMILFGVTMILHEVCWNRGVPVLGFSQPTVKKALVGHGHAKKDQMVEAAKERWPLLTKVTHDEADALGVGLAFFATQQPQTPEGDPPTPEPPA